MLYAKTEKNAYYNEIKDLYFKFTNKLQNNNIASLRVEKSKISVTRDPS